MLERVEREKSEKILLPVSGVLESCVFPKRNSYLALATLWACEEEPLTQTNVSAWRKRSPVNVPLSAFTGTTQTIAVQHTLFEQTGSIRWRFGCWSFNSKRWIIRTGLHFRASRLKCPALIFFKSTVWRGQQKLPFEKASAWSSQSCERLKCWQEGEKSLWLPLDAAGIRAFIPPSVHTLVF